ncbi:MAG: Gfo/Idh/MocA family oxidoreductase [Chloroflexi bacterium]|nr:Gfo/Idh/MocA family oxidoreductase [Chloroflexota bacterium]
MRMAQYGIAHDHAHDKSRVLRETEEVEFVGVYEPDQDNIERLGGQTEYKGVHWFSSKEEMLEDESIVAIAVEGEIFDNLRFAREVVEHGKHVWLDKPAGNDLAEFREVLDIAAARNLNVQLSYMYRYDPGFNFVVDWATSGRLGDIFSIRGRLSAAPGSADRWKLWESPGVRAGGILFIMGGHLVDIIVSILGRPERVTLFQRHDAESFSSFAENEWTTDPPWYFNNTAAIFEYPEAMVSLESTNMELDSWESRRFEVYGTRGSVILEPFETRRGSSVRPEIRLCLDEDRDGFAKGWQTVPVPPARRYFPGLASLLATIRGEKAADRTLEHEFLVQETLLRAIGLA